MSADLYGISILQAGWRGTQRRVLRSALGTLVWCLAILPVSAFDPGAADLQRQAVRDLATRWSVMSVAAHPDDEDSEALTMMRMKWGVRASIVVSNYGEGGQNAVGPELYDDLGAVRYHELRSAAAYYRVSSVLSLGFVDFGFSKTAEETFRFWGGQEEVVRRMVAAIRRERPLVIITNHTVDQGHGNHRAVAIGLKEAFRLAGNAQYHPELGAPWQPLRLFQSAQRPPQGAAVTLQTSEVDPLTGQTYAEIARTGYLQHASQGPFPVPYIGPRLRQYTLWDSASPEKIEGAEHFLSGLPQYFPSQAAAALEAMQARYAALAGGSLVPDSQAMLSQIARDTALVTEMRKGLSRESSDGATVLSALDGMEAALSGARSAASGLRATWDLMSIPEESVAKIGSTSDIDNLLRSRPINEAVVGDYAVYRIGLATPAMLTLDSVSRKWPDGWTEVKIFPVSGSGKIWNEYGIVRLGTAAAVTEPFRSYYKKDAGLPVVSWSARLLSGSIEVPFTWTTTPRIFPRIQMAVSPDHWLAWSDQDVDATVRVTNRANETVRGKLTASSGASLDIDVAPSRTESFRLPVRVRKQRNTPEEIRFAGQDGTTAGTQIQVRPGDLTLPPLGRVGLVRHTDSTTEEALRNLGVAYNAISHDELLSGDLKRYQTILVDHRSYVLVPDLVENNERLLDFARSGGNLVVFYQRAQEFNIEAGYPQLAPDPLHISSDRVSVEEAAIDFLKPEHALMSRPNRIRQPDFDNWVQERGLYFPDKWDPKCEALLSSHDPDEKPLGGGLLVCPAGTGTYIYTTYVWYRQWKELNNGAYRMLANFLAYGAKPQGN